MRRGALSRKPASGAQTVLRAVGLLKVLASGPRQGWRLSDLAAACSLDRATAHRILKTLETERLVIRDGSRRYAPGPMLFELGLSYSRPVAFIQAVRRPLRAVASGFGAVGTLWLRSGLDVVCAERLGTTRTKVFVDVGTRRPLASMAPGISILLALSAAERRTLIAENLRRMDRLYPGRLGEFRAMLARSERAGYGVTLGDVGQGMYSVGAPIVTPQGEPVAALCLIGPTRDLPETRVEHLASRLHAIATELSDEQVDLLGDWQSEVSHSET